MIRYGEERFREAALIDADGDGQGEYGGLLEMAGLVRGRLDQAADLHALARVITLPRPLSPRPEGAVQIDSYLYRLFLPGDGGTSIGERADGFRRQEVVADTAERAWCVCAWPAHDGAVKNRAFFADQTGIWYLLPNEDYVGIGRPPVPGGLVRLGEATGEPGWKFELPWGGESGRWVLLGQAGK